MAVSNLLPLPRDILVSLPDYLHNIEDFMSLASTCRSLRSSLEFTSHRQILRLAAAQENVFFRPEPHYLVALTARELGKWARQSDQNEAELASRMALGISSLLDLALEHCGCSMQRIRRFHQLRHVIINPMARFMEGCEQVGWYSSGRHFGYYGPGSDSETTVSDADPTFLLLAIYGELFGPDFDFIFNPADSGTKRLSVATRMEFMKYCVSDRGYGAREHPDPQLTFKPTGPYDPRARHNNRVNFNTNLKFGLSDRRWRAQFTQFVKACDCGEVSFTAQNVEMERQTWPQVWEGFLLCQGLEGFSMISPAIPETERVERWGGRIREWKARFDSLSVEPLRSKAGDGLRMLDRRFEDSSSSKVFLAMRDTKKIIRGLSVQDEQEGGRPNSRQPNVRFMYTVHGASDIGLHDTIMALKSGGAESVVFVSMFAIHGDPHTFPPSDLLPWAHAQVEINLAEMFGPHGYVAVRPTWFATNILNYRKRIRDGTVKIPYAQLKYDWITPGDIGSVVGCTVNLVGPEQLSNEEATKMIGKAIGKNVQVIDVGYGEGKEVFMEDHGLPEFLTTYLVRGLHGDYEGDGGILNDPLYKTSAGNIERELGRPPTRFQEWIHQKLDAFTS